MKQLRFSLIGAAGFRAQAYLRIANAIPEMFKVCGMVIRNETLRADMEMSWGIQGYENVEQLLNCENPDFIVVSVRAEESSDILVQLSAKGVPILAETPAAMNLDTLLMLHEELTLKGAKIQVAEQYHLLPTHAARLSLVRSGRLGNVHHVMVSTTQNYHAMSLIRKYLNIGAENADIRTKTVESNITAGPTRSGPPTEDKQIRVNRDIAWIDFGDKFAIYDFEKDQHRSWIRSNHVSIRGSRGEIVDEQINLLQSAAVPLHFKLNRIQKGQMENLEGHYLEGIIAGEQWCYRNPFIPGRLYDDEIAIASCLVGMKDYVSSGVNFYSFAEASQDQYLALMMEESKKTGELVRTERQSWADFINS